jgi:hypothetical protein
LCITTLCCCCWCCCDLAFCTAWLLLLLLWLRVWQHHVGVHVVVRPAKWDAVEWRLNVPGDGLQGR